MNVFVGKEEMGKRLKALRDKTSYTQAEVAEACDVTESAMSNYEQGERAPRDEIKVNIANFYGVSVQSIFFK